MQNDKTNEAAQAKEAYWFRDPANIFLIAVVLVTGCCYLINPVIELLAP